jgi:NAD(P)-dependent dehydrogenase (short-subunit alcohol dehydrogenase family)
VKRLADQRVLVVGASAGIGRAVAVAAAEAGARVAAAARRTDLLEALASELEEGVAVPLDVQDPDSCRAGIGKAVRELGSLDAVVYVVGTSVLSPVSEVAADTWARIFATNVTGASLVMAEVLPHLAASRGRAIFISSISADDFPPRRGLGPYMVSKAALNKLVEVWQSEHHEVSFTRLSVGDTLGTEFAEGWDLGDGAIVREWTDQGLMFGRTMRPEAVGRHVVDLLASEEAVLVSRLVPRYED